MLGVHLGMVWAHPRSRGEHFLNDDAEEVAEGSSPLTRGALFVHVLDFSVRGLIPAHAGSTA